MGGGTEAFPDLGAHCSHEDCHQLDFLPFKCDSCQQTFCLEHRSQKGHNCAKEGMNDTIVVICPACAGTVRTVFGESFDLTIEKHMQKDCDPSNYNCVMKKLKCPVKRCREVLTTTNTYACKKCNTKICMKHRFPADHVCATTAKSQFSALDSLHHKFMKILSGRNGTECATTSSKIESKLGSSSSQNVIAH